MSFESEADLDYIVCDHCGKLTQEKSEDAKEFNSFIFNDEYHLHLCEKCTMKCLKSFFKGVLDGTTEPGLL